MKKKDIIYRLKNGSLIRKRQIFKFKYNKLIRGSYFEYDIDGDKITKSNFESLQGIIKKLPSKFTNECFYIHV